MTISRLLDGKIMKVKVSSDAELLDLLNGLERDGEPIHVLFYQNSTDKGLKALARSPYMANLEELSLRVNSQATDVGATALAKKLDICPAWSFSTFAANG